MTELASEFDVVVIGRGFAGLTLATELAQLGVCRILIVYDDKDKTTATDAAHGISTIKGILEADSELFARKIIGHQGFEQWLSSLEKITGKRRPDGVWQKRVEESFESLEKFRKEFGRIYRRDFVGAKNVITIQSDRDAFVKNIYPADFWIDPIYLNTLLVTAAQKLGVSMITGRVVDIKPAAGASVLTLNNGQNICAKNTAICAGAGTAKLIPSDCQALAPGLFAVDGFTFKSVSNGPDFCEVKGTSGFIRTNCNLFWGSTSAAAIPLKNGKQKFEQPTSDEGKKSAISLLKKISCNIDFIENIYAKWGVRVRTRDRSPAAMCLNSERGIWLNTGYYKSGIILSRIFSKMLAAQIVSRLKSFDPDGFPVADSD